MSRLPLLLLWLIPELVFGQTPEPSRFFPFHPGNKWDYTVSTTFTYSNTNQTTTTLNGFAEVAALRDTVVVGEHYSIYSIISMDSHRNVTSQKIYRGRVTNGRWEDVSVSSNVTAPPDFGNLGYLGSEGFPFVRLGTVSPGGSVEINGTTHSVEATAEFNYGFSGCGSGGMSCDWVRLHAADLGLFYAEYKVSRTGPGPYVQVVKTRLSYAEVDGRTFGTVVGTEPAGPVPSDPGLSVATFPNPTSARSTLVIKGELLSPRHVAVYDLIGRVVWSEEWLGDSALSIDLTNLPPGVYLVRVRDRSRATASTRVVRR